VTRQRAVRAGRRRAAEIARDRRSDHLLELSDKGGSSRRRAPTCCGRWCRTLRRRCWGRRSTRSAARPMVSVRRSGATGATATASATGTRASARSSSRCRSCVRAPTSRTGRRAARAPQRRRTARSELGPHSATPARPWRQPAAQRRALPDRDHAGALQPGRTRLPRAQTQRRQEQTRSTPLPQTTPRPRRLQDPKSEHRLDIGATLAHPTDDSHPIERRTAHA
jgi:hypothetical protein